MTENLIISQEKIHSIRIQMTPTNAEFNDEVNEIRLTMQIETENRRKKERKNTVGRENLSL